MKKWILLNCLLLSFSSIIFAAASPEGSWVSLDDNTGEKRAIITLNIVNGELKGFIQETFPLPGDSGICSNCPGNFKNKPIKGLEIVWGLKENKPGIWEGGQILDAKAGKLYHVKMTVKNDKLYVRGYIGVSMIGRTQVWERA